MVQTTRKCSIEDCGRKRETAKGWCLLHYKRWKRHGDPLKRLRKRFQTPEESFKARTEETAEGCIIWTGEVWRNGYGGINIPGGRKTGAHRYAWERVNGRIPEGKHIDHTCFNRRCVNVEHLRMVDRYQNAQHLQGAKPGSSTDIRGVRKHPGWGKYTARVTSKGIEYYLGSFDDPLEAGKVAALKRKELGFPLSDHDRQLINGTFRLTA